MKKMIVIIVAVLCVVWLGMSGCVVTQSSVKKQIDERVGEVQNQVEANRQEIASLKSEHIRSLEQKQEETLTLSSDAMEMGEEALARAEEAGRVAQGKLLYQVTFTDEAVHFGFDRSNLSKEAKAALDEFSNTIKAANKNIYLEIQGHTDSIGTKEYNMMLGQARADRVMRYLHIKHGIPLHRLNTFSYGESRPIVDNKTRSNRAKNRRVTLVVIQ
ncbi:MAG: OmpA family protein [Deltaproteobacteria bacterium]|nr:OmpA family protein [Deltaproteobacteria bacterium]MBW2077173.1 OmpA family protein [Deltaproteobacteria bacterium]